MGTRKYDLTPAEVYARWRALKWCSLRKLADSLGVSMYAVRKLTAAHLARVRQTRTRNVRGSTNME